MRGFAQATLAEAVDIAAEAVLRYAHQRRRPSRGALLRIARALLLDDGATTFILTESGLEPVPSGLARSVAGLPSSIPRFWPGRWEGNAQHPHESMPPTIAAHSWPCLVVDSDCRIFSVNPVMKRVLGSVPIGGAGSSECNLLQLVLSRPFRAHTINYAEVVSVLMPGGLKDLLVRC